MVSSVSYCTMCSAIFLTVCDFTWNFFTTFTWVLNFQLVSSLPGLCFYFLISLPEKSITKYDSTQDPDIEGYHYEWR